MYKLTFLSEISVGEKNLLCIVVGYRYIDGLFVIEIFNIFRRLFISLFV